MSKTKSFAESELDILVKSCPDPENPAIIAEFIPEILALVDKFGKSGQSGASAPYTASALTQAIKKLLLQEPICPITGIDAEWINVSERQGKQDTYQNSRCGALFKDGQDSQAHYLDAIVWKTQRGTTWSGTAYLENGEKVFSRQNVKSYPFTPKTFTIDVIEKEVKPDDWEFYVKDEKQLDEVFEYYDKFVK